MYGQTNCFVGPDLQYGVWAINEQEAVVCTHRAARNMLYQGVFTPKGEVQDVNERKLAELDGKLIIGSKIKAPFAINPEVYVLPMETVLATKVRDSPCA